MRTGGRLLIARPQSDPSIWEQTAMEAGTGSKAHIGSPFFKYLENKPRLATLTRASVWQRPPQRCPDKLDAPGRVKNF